MDQPLEALVRGYIEETVMRAETATRYRRPLVAFVSADCPDFLKLKSEVDPEHLLPGDILPRGRTVVSFFVPFHPDIVRSNAGGGFASREWAVAYIETNDLIGRVCAGLAELLLGHGFECRWEAATHHFDSVRLVSRWSHKSIAVVAGLGSFGLHQMVITDAGCAGRFGSLVTTAELQPSGLPLQMRCRYLADRRCRACIRRCPVGALHEDGFDRQLCYRRCLEVDAHYSDLGLTDVCGKCATGPCALAPHSPGSLTEAFPERPADRGGR